jgi:endonuclease G, mitochondrial
MKAPTKEELANRIGYNSRFLGLKYQNPMPVFKTKQESTVLHYTHFSVSMNLARKTAWFTAVNIDGGKSVELHRDDSNERWFLDPRIPKKDQAGDKFYAGNKLDKGHLVRRLDPVWGTVEEATQANNDTFFYTNASAQHQNLNRIEWNNLEDYVLNNSIAQKLKINVFTGPILRIDDPLHKDIPIPKDFWKIVVMVKAETKQLSATAYALSQTDLMSDLEAFEFGEYKTYQITVQRVEELTGLDFGKLKDFDPKSMFESVGATVVKGFKDMIF